MTGNIDRERARETILWADVTGSPAAGLYSGRSQGCGSDLTIWGMGIAETHFDADGFHRILRSDLHMGDTKIQKLDRVKRRRRTAEPTGTRL